jgi:hypothetical protein
MFIVLAHNSYSEWFHLTTEIILLPLRDGSGTVFSNNLDCMEKLTSTILYFTAFEIASKDGSYVSSCHTSEGNKQQQ